MFILSSTVDTHHVVTELVINNNRNHNDQTDHAEPTGSVVKFEIPPVKERINHCSTIHHTLEQEILTTRSLPFDNV